MRQYFQHPRQPPFHLSDGRVEEPSSSHLPSQPSFKSVVVTFACFCNFSMYINLVYYYLLNY